MTSLSSPFASPADAAQGGGAAAPAAPSLYVWQHYTLRTGQPRRLGEYFAKARVPALTRAGAGPVGVFEPIAGPPQPSLFSLTPFASTAPFLALEDTFAKDAEYQAAAAPYADATAADPAYVRQETWLLQAFPTFPRVELPPQTAAKAPRIFELRIYESCAARRCAAPWPRSGAAARRAGTSGRPAAATSPAARRRDRRRSRRRTAPRRPGTRRPWRRCLRARGTAPPT